MKEKYSRDHPKLAQTNASIGMPDDPRVASIRSSIWPGCGWAHGELEPTQVGRTSCVLAKAEGFL